MASRLIGRFGGFEKDIASLEKQVRTAMLRAGDTLQADMKSCLSEHITADVYEAYEPEAYVRREDNGGVMGVKRPFDDTEQFFPYVSSMAAAPVGAQVVIVVFGEGRNAKSHMVFMYPDGRNL